MPLSRGPRAGLDNIEHFKPVAYYEDFFGGIAPKRNKRRRLARARALAGQALMDDGDAVDPVPQASPAQLQDGRAPQLDTQEGVDVAGLFLEDGQAGDAQEADAEGNVDPDVAAVLDEGSCQGSTSQFPWGGPTR